MALPTHREYFKNYQRTASTAAPKDLAERNIVRQREREDDSRTMWSQNARYFQDREMYIQQNKNWTSDKSFHSSMDTYEKDRKKERTASELQRRREKLTSLMASECEVMQRDMKEINLSYRGNSSRIADIKQKVDGIKALREDERKKIAQQKLTEHWKQNEPELREFERNRHNEHVVKTWKDQVDDKDLRLQLELDDEDKMNEMAENERLEALETERRILERRRCQELDRADVLKSQMSALKVREEEAAELKVQERVLMNESLQLEEIEHQRRNMEIERKKSELGRFLTKQWKAQLIRRHRQIQEELEFDRKILMQLSIESDFERQLHTTRREKSKENLLWMKSVLEDQLKLEQQREAELDLMYREEGERVWRNREAEWERERISRLNLMQEVLDERSDQVRDRMASNQEKQRETIQEREEIIRDLEDFQQTQREDLANEKRRKQRIERELANQINNKQGMLMSARDEQAVEEMADEREHQIRRKLIEQEKTTLAKSDYQPPQFGRRGRHAWMD